MHRVDRRWLLRAGALSRRHSCLTIALSSAALALFAFARALPNPLFAEPLATALYAEDGRLLGARIAADGQWRLPAAPGAAVPARFAAALVAFEDKRFHRHPGVDPLALGRAALANARRGGVVSGGSTLSMQVVRLARGNRARTVGEKALEAVLALRLELGRSKAEVLALYAAHAPFGGNVVGLEAAAWRYFGRAPASLSWAEAATLAVLPNAPALIHPGRGRARLLAKRDRLLARLRDRGALTRLEHDLAVQEPLPGAPLPLPRAAPHLLDTLAARGGRADFARGLPTGGNAARDTAGSDDDRDAALRRSSSLHTTLDARLQAQVNAALAVRARTLAAQGVHNAAVLVVENATLAVRAYAGNRLAAEPGEVGAEGLAVDLVQAPRSTGSVLKPFLYAALLQEGLLQPGSLVPDVPMQFDGFRPENFDRSHRGAVTARLALAQSLNVPAVALLRQFGLARYHELLRHAGLTTLTRPAEHYGLTLVLGGAEGRLWDLAQAYANLARIAQAGAPRGRARLGTLRVLAGEPRREDGARADYGAGAAWLTLDALEEVTRPEAEQHWRNFASTRRLAWKTGTSHGLRDGWAIGTSPRHTVAVWVGNAGGRGVAGLTGSGMAAPLLFDVFGLLGDAGWFPRPDGDLKTVQVCADDGWLPAAGCATVAALIPRQAHFERVSRTHRQVHLDATGTWRVDARCEPLAGLVAASWFVLPPAQEYFYRRHAAGYRSLPPLRPDCRALADADAAGDALGGSALAVSGDDDATTRAFDLLYPEPGAAVYIPTDLGGVRSQVVFKAAHRRRDAALHWHLDGRYLATTRNFHTLGLDLPAGAHLLTVVDDGGAVQRRRFKVLEEGR